MKIITWIKKLFKRTPVFKETPVVEPDTDYNPYNYYNGDTFHYTNKRGVRKEFLVRVDKSYEVEPVGGLCTLEVSYLSDPTPRDIYKRTFKIDQMDHNW